MLLADDMILNDLICEFKRLVFEELLIIFAQM